MAKYATDTILAFEAKKQKRKKEQKYSFWRDAWRRLRRNRTAVLGMVIIILLLLAAIFAPAIIPYSYTSTDVMAMYQTPNADHWFGTDNLGRDIFSRCIYATRVSIPIGIVSAVVSVFVGGVFGLIAAYFAGAVDLFLMRVMDVLQAIPSMMMAIIVIAALGTGTVPLLIAVGMSCVPQFAKTVRSAVLTVRSNEYIDASRSLGAGNLRLMFRHIIPNCVGFVLIVCVQIISGNIMFISSLSYIGLGITPPTPEWGAMLSAAKTYIQTYPHMVIFPGLMIMLTVFGFNLFADGVRDALDPRLK